MHLSERVCVCPSNQSLKNIQWIDGSQWTKRTSIKCVCVSDTCYWFVCNFCLPMPTHTCKITHTHKNTCTHSTDTHAHTDTHRHHTQRMYTQTQTLSYKNRKLHINTQNRSKKTVHLCQAIPRPPLWNHIQRRGYEKAIFLFSALVATASVLKEKDPFITRVI